MVSLTTMPVLNKEATVQNISPSELSQRVAVIKRFRELLKAQRDRFQAYLNALDKQKNVIETGTADDLLRHVEMEEKIVEDIFSIQRVIEPLEDMYRRGTSASGFGGGLGSTKIDETEDEVSGLKNALESLKSEAALLSARNRDLLAKRMAEIRSEINSLKSNAYARRRFDSGPAPSLVDLQG